MYQKKRTINKMTAIELSRTNRGLLHLIGRRISDFLDGIAEARGLANRYRTLSRMTDKQLADRGLTRQEIPHAILAGLGL